MDLRHNSGPRPVARRQIVVFNHDPDRRHIVFQAVDRTVGQAAAEFGRLAEPRQRHGFWTLFVSPCFEFDEVLAWMNGMTTAGEGRARQP